METTTGDQFYTALKDTLQKQGFCRQTDVLDIASHEQMTLDQFQQWTNRFIVAVDERRRQISKTRDHLNDAEIDLGRDPVPKIPFQGLVNDDKYDDRQALATEVAKLAQRAEATDLLLATVKDTGEYNAPHLVEFPQRGKLDNDQYLIQLRKFLISHLSFQELEGLATSFLNAEEAEQVVRQGRGVNSRALNFVSHFQRHGSLDQLAQAVNDYVQRMGLTEGANIPQRKSDAEQTRETLLKEENFWQAAHVIRSCFDPKNPDKTRVEIFLKDVSGFENFVAQPVTPNEEISQDRLMVETIVFANENGLLGNLMTTLATSDATKEQFAQAAKQTASLSPIPQGQKIILNYDQLLNVIAMLRPQRCGTILDDIHMSHSYAKYPADKLETIVTQLTPDPNTLGLIVQSVIESTQTYIPPKPEEAKKSRAEDYVENASSFQRFAETGYLLNTCFDSMEELHEFVLGVRGFERFARWRGKTKNQLALEIFLEADDKANLLVLAQALVQQKTAAVENALLTYQQTSAEPIEDLAQQEIPFAHEMATIAYLSPSSYQEIMKMMQNKPREVVETTAKKRFLELMKEPVDLVYQLFRSVRSSISTKTILETDVFRPVVFKSLNPTYTPPETPVPPPQKRQAQPAPISSERSRPETQIMIEPQDHWIIGFILRKMMNDEEFTTFMYDHYRPVYEKYSGPIPKSIKMMQTYLHAWRQDQEYNRGVEEFIQTVAENNPSVFMNCYSEARQTASRTWVNPKSLDTERKVQVIAYFNPKKYGNRLSWPADTLEIERMYGEAYRDAQSQGKTEVFNIIANSVK